MNGRIGRPPALAVIAAFAIIALVGLRLWQGTGIDVWLQQVANWCM